MSVPLTQALGPKVGSDLKRTNYIAEVVLFVLGLAIMLSPNGEIPRTGAWLGDYKYAAGAGLWLLAGWLLTRRTGD